MCRCTVENDEQPQPQPPPDGNYSNIREVLGALIGRTVIEITQHDKDEWKETKQSYFCLHFDNGATMTIPVNDAAVTLEWPGTDCDTQEDPDATR